MSKVTRHRGRLVGVLAGAMLLGVSASSEAQQNGLSRGNGQGGTSTRLATSGPDSSRTGSARRSGVSLVVDQKARAAKLFDGYGNERNIADGSTVRVRRTDSMVVQVRNSNSALYRCELTDSAVAVPVLDSLKLFAKALGTYAADLPLGMKGLGVASEAFLQDSGIVGSPTEEYDSLRTYLVRVDSLNHGSWGVNAVELRALAVLDSLRPSDDFKPAGLPLAVGGGVACKDAGCTLLKAPGELARTFEKIAETRRRVAPRTGVIVKAARRQAEADARARKARPLAVAAAGDSAAQTVGKALDSLLKAADAALAARDTILSSAYRVESLVRQTATADTVLTCKTVGITWDKGRSLSLAVVPRTENGVSRLATREKYELKATVMPDWFIRPHVGLGLLIAQKAAYDKFAATMQPDSTFSVVQQGVQDNRVMYGLVLGVSIRPLRSEQHNFAVWLPELVVNPESSVRALGLGGGVSYRFLRASYGMLWSKHSVLNGQSVGQTVSSADALSTRDTYSDPKAYWSIAITGWPPFLPSLDK